MIEERFDEEDEAEDLSAEEERLGKLEDRIENLKNPEKRNQALYAKGVGLVLSFGFVLAGCLVAGLLLGDFLVEKTGSPSFKILGIFLGLVVALVAGAKLMGPFLKSDE